MPHSRNAIALLLSWLSLCGIAHSAEEYSISQQTELADQLFQDGRADDALAVYQKIPADDLEKHEQFLLKVRIAKTLVLVAKREMAIRDAASAHRHYRASLEALRGAYAERAEPGERNERLRHGLEVWLWQACAGAERSRGELAGAEPVAAAKLPALCRIFTPERMQQAERRRLQEECELAQGRRPPQAADWNARIAGKSEHFIGTDSPAAFRDLASIASIYSGRAKAAVSECQKEESIKYIQLAKQYYEDYMILSAPGKDLPDSAHYRLAVQEVKSLGMLQSEALSCKVVCKVCRDWRIWVSAGAVLVVGGSLVGLFVAKPWELPTFTVYPESLAYPASRLSLPTVAPSPMAGVALPRVHF